MSAITAERPAITPIPMGRLTSVEVRKMFDTRSGFWLMASVAITATLATVAVIAFASDKDIKYGNFAGAVAFPMSVVLPVIAVLSVTSEWSQRSGLTTFTLVPHRSRVIRAKLIGVIGIGVVSMALALAIGVIGNLVGAAVNGVDPAWDASPAAVGRVVLSNVLGMLVGFMLGTLIRNSAGAIVGYFVYSFVLVGLTALLAANAHWFEVAQPWIDFNFAQNQLLDDSMTGRQWAQLLVSGIIWLVVPLTIGLRLVLRAEVK
jgi:ABC-type transport system involved in multi-copper enzyme maturation permease subunit